MNQKTLTQAPELAPEIETLARDKPAGRQAPARFGAGLMRRVFRPRAEPEAAAVAVPATGTRGRFPWLVVTFCLFVVLPAIAAGVYFAFVASPQYSAETRFTIRAAEMPTSGSSAVGSALTNILGGGARLGAGSTGQNAYIIAHYVVSRGMVEELLKEIDLREIYTRPEADFYARLADRASIDQLTTYWRRMATAYVDGPSGIVTVKVRAFRREDAVRIAERVIVHAEALVNQISERARRDAMAQAENEVRRADAMVRQSLADLRRYRDEEGLINPVRAADETGRLVVAVMTEKIRTESELYVARRNVEGSSPVVQVLASRLESLNQQLETLRATLTGSSPTAQTLARSLVRYEELEVQRQFAERLFMMAHEGLNRARQQAERQAIYLTVFVRPALPDEAGHPERLAMSLIIAMTLLILWSIASLVVASVNDHKN